MNRQPRYRVRVTGPARRDIAAVARWSKREFGVHALARYEALIEQALRDIEKDPYRLFTRGRPESTEQLLTYHIRFSRSGVPRAQQVGRPRHYFVYRISDDVIEILRLLHDAQDLERQLPSGSPV